MRKRLLLAVIIFLVYSSTYCNDSNSELQLPYYPSYRNTIIELLNNYSIKGIEYPNQFRLAKKPDGWHATIVDILKEDIVKDELFWDRNHNKFIKIDFPESEKGKPVEGFQDIIDDWQNNYFNSILPYWGYIGWDGDVIEEYSIKSNLSDTLLNALARAYCSYASNLLNNNTGLSSKELRFNLPKGQNALSKDQIEKYRYYEHKGIETYYKLWEKNPTFETFIADSYNIYSNEVLNCYLTLLYHQNKEEALKELKAGLYDSFFISMARKYLASCDSNAILFTNGDIDTYPLLYIQEYEGFRKDIVVVNMSLLQSGRYISHLFDIVNNPINFTIDKEIYKSDSKQVIYLKEQIESISFYKAIELVASTDTKTKLEYGGNFYDYLPSKSLTIKVDPKIILNFSNLYGASIVSDSIFQIDLNKDYLLMNHFCFLDILSTNGFRRPIYFAVTVDNENYLGLEDYFQCEGFAYKIMPYKRLKHDDSYNIGYIDTDIQYDKLMKDLVFDISKSEQYFSEVQNRITSNYRLIYSRLIENLIAENKNDSALKVLHYCLNEFSFDKVELDFFALPLIESSYKLKQVDIGNKLVEDLLNTSMDISNNQELDDYNIRLTFETLKRLKEITDKYIFNSSLNKDVVNKYNFLKKKQVQ